jgi:hypothetical protein
MATSKLTTIDVRGRKFDISVNENGLFGADFSDQWITAPSLEELREKLVRLTKNTKISIPFIEWDGKKMRHGVCTGRHATNRNLLVKYDDNKTSEQASSWNVNAVDPKVEKDYLAVCVQFEAAARQKTEFEEDHGISLKELIDVTLAADGALAPPKGGA